MQVATGLFLILSAAAVMWLAWRAHLAVVKHGFAMALQRVCMWFAVRLVAFGLAVEAFLEVWRGITGAGYDTLGAGSWTEEGEVRVEDGGGKEKCCIWVECENCTTDYKIPVPPPGEPVTGICPGCAEPYYSER